MSLGTSNLRLRSRSLPLSSPLKSCCAPDESFEFGHRSTESPRKAPAGRLRAASELHGMILPGSVFQPLGYSHDRSIPDVSSSKLLPQCLEFPKPGWGEAGVAVAAALFSSYLGSTI